MGIGAAAGRDVPRSGLWFETGITVGIWIAERIRFAELHMAIAKSDVASATVPAAWVIVAWIKIAIVRGVTGARLWGSFFQKQRRARWTFHGACCNARMKTDCAGWSAEQRIDRIACAGTGPVSRTFEDATMFEVHVSGPI